MTVSKGTRAMQQRRMELFAGEMRLRGAQRHLLDAYSWASLHGATDDGMAVMAAFGLVSYALTEVLKEVQAMA